MGDVATHELFLALRSAAARVPGGRWAVGVSGGADSVALLLLLHERSLAGAEMALHVVHLDHETRGEESRADAQFVASLAERLGLPCTIAPKSEVERLPGLMARESNPSARYRRLRLALFRHAAAAHGLAGVLLAHHFDDQAETVFERLLRGSGYAGLCGIAPDACVEGVRIVRPLLQVPRTELRRYLVARGEVWREDASNATDAFLRNRARRELAARPGVAAHLVNLAAACRALREWVATSSPSLPDRFAVNDLASLPTLLARESARRWLIGRGVRPDLLDRAPHAADHLIEMAADAATPPRRHFPGGLEVRRQAGVIFVATIQTRATPRL